MQPETQIKAQSKSQLASAYNVSLFTFNKWIKPFAQQVGEYRGKVFTPKQVQKIYDLLGEP